MSEPTTSAEPPVLQESLPSPLNHPAFQPQEKVIRWNEQKLLSSTTKVNDSARLPNGKWAPGHSLVPGSGRIAGRYDFFPELVRTIRKVEKAKGISLLTHAIERCYVSDAVLIAVMKKILPDLTSETGSKGPQVVNIMLTHRSGEYALPESPSENAAESVPVNRHAAANLAQNQALPLTKSAQVSSTNAT